MFTYNDNGQWEVGSVQHTDDWVEIIKDEQGVITSPPGLVEQVAREALQKNIDEVNQEARDYLISTDWMVLRELRGGKAVTAEVNQLRLDAAARVK